ncbi:MAG TPA: VOC family protein [Hyphomicrobiaceae bacterium]|jgi:catechol 2,3-dioxygenase-like lactoylglutathione lyase family enzyme|nr:VOC family protein [Hyphomicrobiaceae bacterium]
MIHALDHIGVAAASLARATADYELLLGQRARRSQPGSDADRALFDLGNMRLVIHPASQGEAGLASLGFSVADLGKARRLLEQRGLSTQDGDGDSARISSEGTHGVACTILERAPAAAPRTAVENTCEPDAAVSGLDHIVIRSPDPERAIALYAGRLGLSLRLDRRAPEWGVRLLFFRCGDLIVEVAHDLKAGVGTGPDRLWGISWRVPDIDKAHARLRTGAVDVSGVRAGRRPHTRVFTVKSHSAGVPTLIIGPA